MQQAGRPGREGNAANQTLESACTGLHMHEWIMVNGSNVCGVVHSLPEIPVGVPYQPCILSP